MSNKSTETIKSTLNETDEKLVAQCDVSVRRRCRVELRVVRQLLSDLRASGYEVTADNGEDGEVAGTDDQLIESLFAVDEATVRTRSARGQRSFVFLVFGNDGWDTVNDYGISLEGTMAAFNDWCDKEQEAGH